MGGIPGQGISMFLGSVPLKQPGQRHFVMALRRICGSTTSANSGIDNGTRGVQTTKDVISRLFGAVQTIKIKMQCMREGLNIPLSPTHGALPFWGASAICLALVGHRPRARGIVGGDWGRTPKVVGVSGGSDEGRRRWGCREGAVNAQGGHWPATCSRLKIIQGN